MVLVVIAIMGYFVGFRDSRDFGEWIRLVGFVLEILVLHPFLLYYCKLLISGFIFLVIIRKL
jgi:hypothetical protein